MMARTITTHNRVVDFILIALGMYVVSFGLAALGGYTGTNVVGSGDFLALGLAILGALAGFVLGIILGLVLVKTALRQPGSVLLGILAAVVWTAVSIGVTALFNLVNNASSAFVAALFLSTPVVALLGYYFRELAGENKS